MHAVNTTQDKWPEKEMGKQTMRMDAPMSLFLCPFNCLPITPVDHSLRARINLHFFWRRRNHLRVRTNPAGHAGVGPSSTGHLRRGTSIGHCNSGRSSCVSATAFHSIPPARHHFYHRNFASTRATAKLYRSKSLLQQITCTLNSSLRPGGSTISTRKQRKPPMPKQTPWPMTRIHSHEIVKFSTAPPQNQHGTG